MKITNPFMVPSESSQEIKMEHNRAKSKPEKKKKSHALKKEILLTLSEDLFRVFCQLLDREPSKPSMVYSRFKVSIQDLRTQNHSEKW